MQSLPTTPKHPATPLAGRVVFAPVQYGRGFFLQRARIHRSDSSTLRSSSDCACRSLAATVSTRRRNARSAARALSDSFEVLSMAPIVFATH